MSVEILVSNSAQLENALRNADGGETILLAPSDEKYKVSIWRSTLTPERDTITIKSADTDNPAVIEQLLLYKQTDLHFSDLVFDAEPPTNHNKGALLLIDSKDILITDTHFRSSADEWGQRGDPDLRGLEITGSTNVTVTDSEFSNLKRAISHRNNDDITITNNDFHSIQEDGIRGGGVNGLTISGNHFHDWLGIDNSWLHADFIQLWSAATDRRTENVTITDNIFTGEGPNTAKQVIFSRNDAIDLNGLDREAWEFRNWTVSNNVIDVPTSQGIKLTYVNGLDVSNNTLTYPGGIAITHTRNATITDNVAHTTGGSNNENVSFTDNVLYQRDDIALGDHQDYLFSNIGQFRETGDLAQLKLRDDSFGDRGDNDPGADVFSLIEGDGPFFVVERLPFSYADPNRVTLELKAYDAEGREIPLPAGEVVWTLGDGTTLTGAEISHLYDERGTYDIGVALIDGSTTVASSAMRVVLPSSTLFELGVTISGAADVSIYDGDIEIPANALALDPESGLSVLEVPSSGGLSFDPGFSMAALPSATIAFTYRLTSDDAVGHLMTKSQTVQLLHREDGRLHFSVADADRGGWRTETVPGLDLDSTEWRHIAITFDTVEAGAAKLYVDGVLVSEIPMDWLLTGDDREFDFGGGIPFAMRDFTVSDRAWTPEQVAEEHAEKIGLLDTVPLVPLAIVDSAVREVASLGDPSAVSVDDGGRTVEHEADTRSEIRLDPDQIDGNLVVRLTLEADAEGALIGLGLANGALTPGRIFKLAGSSTPDGAVTAYDGYDPAAGAQQIALNVGAYLSDARYDRLVLINDGATGDVRFSDIEIFEGLKIGNDWVEIDRYTAQDGGAATLADDGLSLTQTTNAWTEIVTGRQTVSDDMLLSFDFSSSDEGEVHGVALLNGAGDLDVSRMVKLFGTQEIDGVITLYDTYDLGQGVQRFELDLGALFAGATYDRIVFFTDDDAEYGSNSTYANIEISDGGGVTPPPTDGGQDTPPTGGGSQGDDQDDGQDDPVDPPQDDAGETEVWLVDTASGERVQRLDTEETIDLALFADPFSVEAIPAAGMGAESIRFSWNNYVKTENVEPYAMFGDTISALNPGSLPEGDGPLVIEIFSEDNAGGTTLARLSFEVAEASGGGTPSDPPDDDPVDDPDTPADPVEALLIGDTAYDVEAFDSQNGGSFALTDGGETLVQTTNAWTEIVTGRQTVGDDMRLSFDFHSTDEGEAHGVALLNGDGDIDTSRIVKIFGTQNFDDDVSGYDIYDPSQGTRHFDIDIGAYFAGEVYDRIVFFTDDDAGNGSNSTYTNIEISDAPEGLLVGDTRYAPDAFDNQNGGSFALTDGGRVLSQTTNAWTEIKLGAGTVQEGMRLSFDFTSTNEGEVHGVALVDGGGDIDTSRIVKIFGTQTFNDDVSGYDTYDASQGTQRFDIDLGSYFAGESYDRLVFITDDDAGGGSNSTFANIEIDNLPDALLIGDVSYAPEAFESQNGGSFTLGDDGESLSQGTNAWTEVILGNGTVQEGMRLSFDFTSTNEGEAHGVALVDGDGDIDVSRLIKIYGTQTFDDAVDGYDTYDASQGTQRFDIDLGSYFAGESYDRLVFITDDDAGGGSNSTFANIEIA